MTKIVWILTLILFGACSSGTPGGTGDVTTDVGDTAADEGTDAVPDSAADAGTDAGTDAGADVSDDPFAGIDLTPDPTCGGAYIVGTTGFVFAEDGTALDETFVQICAVAYGGESLVCLSPKKTKNDGSFAIVIPTDLRCLERATTRILKPGTSRITEYCLMDLEDPEIIVDWAEPFILYDTYAPMELPEEGDPDTVRTVVLHDGMEIDLVPSEFFAGGAPYEDLTSRRLPASASACAPQSAPVEFEAIYVFQPEGDAFHTSFNARIPNDYGLAAGDQVDLYVLGGLSCGLLNGDKVEEMEWANYGVGTVDESGTFIDASGENGLPCMVWLGLDIPTP